MPNVRQTKKHRAARAKPVMGARSRRKLLANRRGRVNIVNDTVRKYWDPEKNMAQNFRDLGLVIDPNASATESRKKVITRRVEVAEKVQADPDHVEEVLASAQPADTAAAPKTSGLVAELEQQAATRKPKEAFSARGEALFVQQMIDKHGDDYEAMARDHALNVYQHSAGQIRARIKKFQKTVNRFAALKPSEADADADN